MASTNAWMVVPGPLTSPVGLAEVMRILRLGPPRFRPFALPGPLRLLRLLIALSTPSQRCQCSRKTKSRAWDLSPANTGDAPSCPALLSSVLDLRTYLEPLLRPDNESVTPPSKPSSLTFCPSLFRSACLASFFAWLVLCFCAVSSSAAAFLCCARPSSFLASSPVKAPQASFALPLALSSTATPFFRRLSSARNYLIRPSAPEPCTWEKSTPIC